MAHKLCAVGLSACAPWLNTWSLPVGDWQCLAVVLNPLHVDTLWLGRKMK